MKIKIHHEECPDVGDSFTNQVKASSPSSCGSRNKEGESIFKIQVPCPLPDYLPCADLSHPLCISHALAERSWGCPEGGICHSQVLHVHKLWAKTQPLQLGEAAAHGVESHEQGRIKACTSPVCKRLICSNNVN